MTTKTGSTQAPAQEKAPPARVSPWSFAAAWFDDPAFKSFFKSRLFWAALALKLILGSMLASFYMRDLFVPFLNYFVESGFSDPWAYFGKLGQWKVFPYPPIMLYVLAVPRWLFSPFLSHGINDVTWLHLLVMRLPLLTCDLGCALVLLKWFRNRADRVLLFYWCSPFVIYISYWHGQLDIIPTALFLFSLYLISRKHFTFGMAVYGLALASKSHLLVAFPFLVIYLYRERKSAALALYPAALTVAVYLLCVLPYLGSPQFRAIVYGSDEQARFYAFQLPLGLSGLSLLLAPGAVVLLCCRFAAYAKQNWDLFMLYMGILFSVFVLLTPPAPGYFLWSLPFLIHFMCREKRANPLPYYVYAATYLTFFWMGSQSDLFDAWRVVIPSVAYWKAPYQALAALMPERAAVAGNFIFTVMEISLAGLILQMYLFGVRSNAVYFMRARPILIGLAGDSGAGKDTFTRCIQDVMGRQRVDVIAGDDYHRWPRGHEMWQVYTHLNVRGNDLHRQQEHSIALSGGSSVIKGTYDHATGEFTEEKVVDPGQMIVFQGLHSLSIEGMRSLYDLKIFLDPDEELRRRWKVQRDGDERGRAPEEVLQDIENRQKDRGRYILPQMEQADLIFRWVPAGESSPGSPEGLPEMALELKAINSINLLDLSMRLSAVQTLGVEHEPFLDTRWQWMKIRGTITREQLEGIAQESIPNLDEIAPGASFLADLPGCRQLMFIACLSYKLQWLGQSYQKRGFLTG